MKAYTIIIDDVKSYFSAESEVYKYFINTIIKPDTENIFFPKENFALLLEQKLNSFIPKLTPKTSSINLSRIKKVDYKGISLVLNLKNEIDYLVYSLIEIYDNTISSKNTHIQINTAPARFLSCGSL